MLRREKDGNNFRPKSTQEGDIKWQKPKHKKVKQIKNIPEEHIRNVSASPTPLSGRVSMATQQKLDSLKSHGIDIEQGVICFMCLGRHMRPACPHYGREVDNTDLCIKALNGSKYAFGFLLRAACTHGENANFGRKLPGKNI